jgi:hypothetical protein
MNIWGNNIVKIKDDEINAGIAWYKRDQWQLLLDIAEDKDKLPLTWEKWREITLNLIKGYKERGLDVKKVKIDIEDLIKYCKKNNLPNTAQTRSHYIAEIISESNKEEK